MFRLLLLLFFYSNLIFAQLPLVRQWDVSFGGSNPDILTTLISSKTGGFYLGGYSQSNWGCTKTSINKGGYDFWIVKCDSIGRKELDLDLGGTNIDFMADMDLTPDGGLIIGGSSYSGVSGDKTKPLKGSGDYWVIKIDANGNFLWDQDYGGLNFDRLSSIRMTSDQGYIIGGSSLSPAGGDKSQGNWDPTQASEDFWIIKIDSLGNIMWEKTYGGLTIDRLLSIRQCADGGYFAAGMSNSGIGGNKSDSTKGNFDYWLLRLDYKGNLLWDKDYGSTNADLLGAMEITNDQGCILGGISMTGISGDKSDSGCTSWDYWVVKVDSSGNIQWDKDFGGNQVEDDLGQILKTQDDGFLICGASYSPISCDKTDANLGREQSWAIKIDSTGNTLWSRTLQTFFPNSDDESCFAVQTKDDGYAFANSTQGLHYQGDKNSNTCGDFDYWLIKFSDPNINTGINNAPTGNTLFSISPNPFQNAISISSGERSLKNFEIFVFNMLGQNVFHSKNISPGGDQNLTLDLSFLKEGLYNLVIKSDTQITTLKIVKAGE